MLEKSVNHIFCTDDIMNYRKSKRKRKKIKRRRQAVARKKKKIIIVKHNKFENLKKTNKIVRLQNEAIAKTWKFSLPI